MASSRPIVCLVTDSRRFADEDRLVRLVAAAATAGVDLVQIRERTLDDRRLLALTRRIVRSVAGTRARVVVNERCDVALAAGAAGVHLRADSIAAPRVRQIAPPDFLIGRSVHSRDEAVRARDGVDYFVMGTIFATTSKEKAVAPAGTDALAEVCRAVDVPVLAIGGVMADKAGDIAAAGAAGFAAIGLFSDASNAHSDDDLDSVLGDLMAAVRRAFTTPPAA
jgi:thiamine-phosphate pyrophosphorylase